MITVVLASPTDVVTSIDILLLIISAVVVLPEIAFPFTFILALDSFGFISKST